MINYAIFCYDNIVECQVNVALNINRKETQVNSGRESHSANNSRSGSYVS